MKQKAFIPKTPLEYTLDLVVEESGEVIQAVEKIKRFGLESTYPTGETNLTRLQTELTDLRATLMQLNAELVACGRDPLIFFDEKKIYKKLQRIHNYAHVSIEKGMLASLLIHPLDVVAPNPRATHPPSEDEPT